MSFGPVQLLVLGFGREAEFDGSILEEVKRLRESDMIRLVDVIVVRKDEAGELAGLQWTDLDQEEATELGSIAGALFGFGAGGEEGARVGAAAGAYELSDGHAFDDDDVLDIGGSIPNGATAAVALIEHRWAIPLRDAIVRTGGIALLDEWIHASDLVLAGREAAAEALE